MRTRTHLTLTVLLMAALGIGVAGMATAQDLHPSRRPSPMGMARITVDDTYMRVVYSRPYKRGRENIFGTEESEALVPFGKIWRTGANEATELTVTGDVTVGGKALAAGTSISDADLAQVKALRASGEQKHKAGQHSESVADLHRAMKLLGI